MTEAGTQPKQKHSEAIFFGLVIVAWGYIIGFSPILLLNHRPWLVLENIIDGFILIGLNLYVRRTGKTDVAGNLTACIGVILIASLVLGSGITGSAYLSLAAPLYFYLLTSKRIAATIWAGSLFTSFLVAYILALAGLVTLPYDKVNFAILLLSYLVTCSAIYIYANQKDKLDTELSAAAASLAREKAGVERKVVQRLRQLSEAQAQLVASIGSLPFGLALIDNDHRILFSNQAFGKLLGHSIPADPAATKSVLSQITADYQAAIDLVATFGNVQQSRRSIEQDIALGPRFFRLLFIPVISAEQIIGTVWVVEDTTEAKALERSRDEFFSIASHELRTPLTAIRGNISMALDHFKEQTKDPMLNEMLTDTYQSSIRLIDIVNDFLEVSRLEQGRIKFEFSDFDAGELIEQIIREFDVSGSHPGLTLRFQPASPSTIPHVHADKVRLQQILVNLISNGLKYTDKGGVNITLGAVGKQIKISVTDTGRGIPVESQHLLFHKFQQASNNILTRDDTQSTGLGLYISNLLATGMSGQLRLEHTEINQGSTFTLELPTAV